MGHPPPFVNYRKTRPHHLRQRGIGETWRKEATIPRDGSNVYSPPAGTTATSGTTIESAKYNAFVADITSDLNAARPVSVGGTGVSTISAAQTAFKIPPFDGAASITGTWEWQNDVGAVFGNGADASISWVSADSALALKVGASAVVEVTSSGAEVTGLVSGTTIGGAMVSTDIDADTGSTTKVPRVAAVEAKLNAVAATAWLAMNGTGTPAMLDSFNFSATITDNGTGNYSVTFSTAMDNANYAVVTGGLSAQRRITSQTVNGFNIINEDDTGVNEDSAYITAVVFGGKA